MGNVEFIPVLLPSLQIPQGLFWDRTRPSDVTVPRPTTCVLTRPVYLRARTFQIVGINE